ncbi:MAG: hypothetical protein HKP55_01890 [Gammaproteobacteria bacterium]|nr:hypothetical protein [Gammaproteobacteria bacterium]
MQKNYKILISILVLLTLNGCLASTQRDKQRADNLQQMIACPHERPVSCTPEKAPVCGILKDGSSWDYDSGCLACTRRVVIGFIPGPCR